MNKSTQFLRICWLCGFVILAADTMLPAAEPIVTVKREVYVPNTVPGKTPWVYVFPGPDGYREEIHTVWSHDGQVRGYGDTPAHTSTRCVLRSDSRNDSHVDSTGLDS